MAQIYTNEGLIESRSKIGSYSSLAGFGIMIVGLVFSFQGASNSASAFSSTNILISYGSLIAGFFFITIGSYFTSRYGLGGHKRLRDAIKGLDKRYILFNYFLPSPYVLLTPYDATVMLLKNQDGEIVAGPKGWRQGGGFLRFFRAFAGDSLGNPAAELEGQKEKMRAWLAERLGPDVEVPVRGFVVFTHPKAHVVLNGVETPVVVLQSQPDALKNALRYDKRTPTLADPTYDAVFKAFANAVNEEADAAEKGWRFWKR